MVDCCNLAQYAKRHIAVTFCNARNICNFAGVSLVAELNFFFIKHKVSLLCRFAHETKSYMYASLRIG